MPEYTQIQRFLSLYIYEICHILFVFTLIIYIGRTVKSYVSRRHIVNRINKLPQLKLQKFHVLGHVTFPVQQRMRRISKKFPHHVYDFIGLNGYNMLFSRENLTNLWQMHLPFVSAIRADSVEVILNHSTELKKAWFYELLHSWLGRGLLTSEDDKWRSRRKLLTPAFHFNILKDFLPIFNKQSKIFVDVLDRYTKEEYVNIVPVVTKCSLDIICESILGTSVHSQTQSFSPYVKAILELASGMFERMQTPWLWSDFIFNISPNGRKYNKNVKVVHDFTNKLIIEKKEEKLKKRRESSSVDNEKKVDEFQRRKRALLDLLLEEHIENDSISEEEIKEEVNTFAFEGHDTTAMGISWALYLIGLHPWVQEKIHQELDAIFNEDDRDATMEDLKDMKYLECVIKECLRLYPSVPAFGRLLRDDVEFQEYVVPKGSTVMIHTYHLHRDPTVFPNPEKFDPDRFTPEYSAGRHPFAYVPFSAGPRNCIGQRFALMEEKTVLSSVLRKYKIRSLDPRDKIHLICELVLRPHEQLRIQIRHRNQDFDFHSVYYQP